MSAGSVAKVWNDGLARGFALIGGDGAAPEPGTIEIVAGLHSGARAELEERSYTIGSSVEADIVLRDPGIAPIHARLHRRRGFVELEAIGGDIVVSDEQILPQGHGRRCSLPVEARIGDARIRLAGPAEAEAEPEKDRRRSPWLLAAGLVSAALIVTLGANTLSMAKPDKSESKAVAALDSGATGALALERHATQAEDQLRQELVKAGIGTLSISNNAGRLVVSGSIQEGQSRSWTEVQSWFDRQFGGRIPLVSDVAIGKPAHAPRLVLQAIWYGDKPYVIAANGARYHEGAFTDDGWMIETIGETELLLSKGGAKVALKYP